MGYSINSIPSWLSITLRLAVLILAVYIIAQNLEGQLNGLEIVQPTYINALFLFLVLWGLNILFDALIWQRVQSFVKQVPLSHALQTNFLSYALSFVTPVNSGEVAARYLRQEERHKQNALILTFWSHFPRLMVKLIVAVSSIQLLEAYLNTTVTLITLSSLLVCLSAVYLKPGWISRLLSKAGINLNRLKRYTIEGRPVLREKLSLLLMALLKFVFYNLQFLILLWLFADPELSLKLLMAIAAFYALSAFIPSWAIADFAVKAGLALLLLAPFDINGGAIVFSNIIIWASNVALPALVGAGMLAKSQGYLISKS